MPSELSSSLSLDVITIRFQESQFHSQLSFHDVHAQLQIVCVPDLAAGTVEFERLALAAYVCLWAATVLAAWSLAIYMSNVWSHFVYPLVRGHTFLPPLFYHVSHP